MHGSPHGGRCPRTEQWGGGQFTPTAQWRQSGGALDHNESHAWSDLNPNTWGPPTPRSVRAVSLRRQQPAPAFWGPQKAAWGCGGGHPFALTLMSYLSYLDLSKLQQGKWGRPRRTQAFCRFQGFLYSVSPCHWGPAPPHPGARRWQVRAPCLSQKSWL